MFKKLVLLAFSVLGFSMSSYANVQKCMNLVGTSSQAEFNVEDLKFKTLMSPVFKSQSLPVEPTLWIPKLGLYLDLNDADVLQVQANQNQSLLIVTSKSNIYIYHRDASVQKSDFFLTQVMNIREILKSTLVTPTSFAGSQLLSANQIKLYIRFAPDDNFPTRLIENINPWRPNAPQKNTNLDSIY